MKRLILPTLIWIALILTLVITATSQSPVTGTALTGNVTETSIYGYGPNSPAVDQSATEQLNLSSETEDLDLPEELRMLQNANAPQFDKKACFNTFLGLMAGLHTISADYNTFVGYGAGWENGNTITASDANRNTYFGVKCGYSNAHGSDNVGLGAFGDVYNGTGESTDISNTIFIGTYSLVQGDDAIAIGYRSAVGRKNSISIGSNSAVSGMNGTALGTHALALGHNSMAMGYRASALNHNEVVIGNNAQQKIGGVVNWSTVADDRFQSDLRQDVPGLDFIKALQPVSYSLNREALSAHQGQSLSPELKKACQQQQDVRVTGFSAQQVAQAARETGYDLNAVQAPPNESADVYTLRYAELIAPLVKANQELLEMVEEQNDQLRTARIALLELRKRVREMEAAMDGKSVETAETL